MRRRRVLDRELGIVLAIATAFAAAVVAQDGAPPNDAPRVSEFVYVSGADTIRFSHDKHRSEACGTCHQAASTSRRSRDDLRPTMTACATCHADAAKPRLQECSACHVGYPQRAPEAVTKPADWRAVRPAPMDLPAAQPNLRFDHAAHVGQVACGSCHAPDQSGEPRLPAESTCNECHDGQTAPSTCSTCHPTDGTTGRIATKRHGIDALLRPDNHAVDWRHRHATVARADGEDCMNCHTEEDCASCHVESVAKPFAVHPPNFLSIHSVDARLNAGNCTDCHAVQTFCTSCHVRANVTTAVGHTPPPRREFHPPGWLDASMPNNHGVAARREITECATCHSEADCISCHAGVNPHPPDFALECGRLLAASGVSCAKCHSDLGSLRQLCR